MKQQIVILRVVYDETEVTSPKSWDWPKILNCRGDCVEVLNHGGVEEVSIEEGDE